MRLNRVVRRHRSLIPDVVCQVEVRFDRTGYGKRLTRGILGEFVIDWHGPCGYEGNTLVK